jgi:sugar phosphate isomerase/epimerase
MKAENQKLRNVPCRLGTTSYIIPADILPNLRFLANRVDDVELVLFESDEYSNLPSPSDVAEMVKIADGSGLTYTVHLPLDAWPGSEDERVRKHSMEKWFRVMDLMAPLNPFAWIVHLNDAPVNDPDALAEWQAQCAKSLDDLTALTNPCLLCVETLGYDYHLIWPMVEARKCSVCLDIGHLVVNGYDATAYCDSWLKHARVLHVHGVDPSGRDHVDLSHLDADLLRYLLMKLKNENHIPRVMTMEIFSQEDFEKSMIVLERILQ